MLLQRNEGKVIRFRCHTGHGYSADSLLSEFKIKTEETLWSAIRALEEDALFMRALARHSAEHHNGANSESWLKKADEVLERVTLVRKALARDERDMSRKKGQILENVPATTNKSFDAL